MGEGYHLIGSNMLLDPVPGHSSMGATKILASFFEQLDGDKTHL